MLSVGMYPMYLVMMIFIILAECDIFDVPLNRRSKHRLYSFLVFILIVFAGCRYYEWPSGVVIFDYGTYEYAYNHPVPLGDFINEYSSLQGGMGSLDPGYVFISSFFSLYVFDSPNLFFLLVSIVSILLLVQGFRKNNIRSGLLLVLFVFLERVYFQYNFIMMRQGIAMAIAWWGLEYVVDRKFRKFLIVCILAGLFHFSGFLFIAAYWLPKLNFSAKFMIIVFPILFICGITGATKLIILNAAELSLSVVGLERLMFYLASEEWAKTINPLNFIEIMPFLYIALKYKREIISTKQGKLFFNMLIFYITFLLIIMNFMGLIRLSSYYIYPYFFLLSFLYSRLHLRGNKIIIGQFLIIYFVIYGVRLCLNYFPGLNYQLFFLA